MGIRTPDLLHAIHARPVAQLRLLSRDTRLTCGDIRQASPHSARNLCTFGSHPGSHQLARNREGNLTGDLIRVNIRADRYHKETVLRRELAASAAANMCVSVANRAQCLRCA
jgi:hypothetical protein